MPISRSVRNFSARCLAPTLVAVSLVLAPAVGTVFLPAAAQAQDAIDFRVALEGYGQWVQHPRWGEVWIPEQVPPDWQPYRLGHWVYTEEWGWYWDSEEDFGWITYHYGRNYFDAFIRDVGCKCKACARKRAKLRALKRKRKRRTRRAG